MILHNIDSNFTWVEPMKNRTEGEMILARQRALAQMKVQGIVPTHQVLDNEISKAYKIEIQAMSMPYQLVPPNDHCRNIAEKAILVPSTTKDRTTTTSPSVIQHQSQDLSICARLRPI